MMLNGDLAMAQRSQDEHALKPNMHLLDAKKGKMHLYCLPRSQAVAGLLLPNNELHERFALQALGRHCTYCRPSLLDAAVAGLVDEGQ